MEENYTKLGQELEKFEAPVDEKGWEAIANDPAVVRYRRGRLLRSAAIYGSAALLVAAIVTTVVLMTRSDKANVTVQNETQQTMVQNVPASKENSFTKQEELENESVTSEKSVQPVSGVVNAQSLAVVEMSVPSQKVTEPVVEKPVLMTAVTQNMPKSAVKTAKSEQKPNNVTKSATSVSSSSNADNSDEVENTAKYAEPEEEDNFKLYIPTAFTPNGDGLNDVFTISANFTPAQFECTIFSRRGERVFYSKSLDNPWDGTKNGSVMPQNVYVYLIKYVDPNGKPCVEKGQVTLLLN